jgi:hypothetical protein
VDRMWLPSAPVWPLLPGSAGGMVACIHVGFDKTLLLAAAQLPWPLRGGSKRARNLGSAKGYLMGW